MASRFGERFFVKSSFSNRIIGGKDPPIADGDRFLKFLETVRFFFPDYRLNLRHIRDVDGHFVTIEEY